MSSNDLVVSLLTKLALATDGALLGVTLAYVAVRSIIKFTATNSALRKIKDAPSLRIADLRSVAGECSDSGEDGDGDSGKLVIVRGIVESKSAVEGNWKLLRNNVLVSQSFGEKAVIIQRTQTCINNEWKGFMGLVTDLRSLFPISSKEQQSSSTRTVPFVLVEAGWWPQSEHVDVNMDGSTHPLPLVTVYHHMQPIGASPITFLQALFGHRFPVGLLDEEKILPLGKEITAVGICRSSTSGTPEIRSCKSLPFFLSEMTKDQMVVDLAFKSKVLLWTGVVVGTIAIGIISFSAVRNWNRWKEWRQQRRIQQRNNAAAAAAADEEPADGDEETGDVPDGQLCVICLTRRRGSAFGPCGHLVCCPRCAFNVLRNSSPKCPVCRQSITNFLRTYQS